MYICLYMCDYIEFRSVTWQQVPLTSQPSLHPMFPFLSASFVRHPSCTLVARTLLVSVLMMGQYLALSPGLPQRI